MARTLSAPCLLLLASLGLGCAGRFARPTTDEVVERTPERIARGEYIVNHLSVCGACHSTRATESLASEVLPGGFLGGGTWLTDRAYNGSVWIPNLTSDEETGVGRWTDDQLMRAIRDGVKPDGSFFIPLHPVTSYQFMSDEDVRSVVAYLRTVPKVRQERPRKRNEIGWFDGLLLLNFGVAMHEPARNVVAPDRGDKVKYGRYIMHLGGCLDCHSVGKMGTRPDESHERYMAGADFANDIPEIGLAWAANLTPDKETGLGRFTPEQIKADIRACRRSDGTRFVEPVESLGRGFAGMTDEDLDALVTYLLSIRPVKNPIPQRQLTEPMRKLLDVPSHSHEQAAR